MSVSMRISKEDCEQWIHDPLINPMTGRSIQKGKATYNDISKACKEKYGITLNDATVEELINECMKALTRGTSDEVGNAFKALHDYAQADNSLEYFRKVKGYHPMFLHAVLFGSEKASKALQWIGKYLTSEDVQHILRELFLVRDKPVTDFRPVLESIPPTNRMFVAGLSLNGDNVFVYACKNNKEDLAELLAEFKVYATTPTLSNTCLLWAASRGFTKSCEYLVQRNSADINVSSMDGKHAIDYALSGEKYETVLQLISLGASITSINLVNFMEQILANSKYRQQGEETLHELGEKYYTLYKAQPEEAQSFTSENYLYALKHFVESQDLSKLDLSASKKRALAIKFYVHLGVQMSGLTDSKTYKEIVSKPTKWWTEKENLKDLRVVIRSAGMIDKVRIHEIKILHNDYKHITLGSIGNFVLDPSIRQVSSTEVQETLQVLLEKGKLLHRTFPLRPKIQLAMYPPSYVDVAKLGENKPNRLPNPPAYTFKALVHDIYSVVRKERYIPAHVLNKLPTKLFSKSFASQRDQAALDLHKISKLEVTHSVSSESKSPVSPVDRTKLKVERNPRQSNPQVNMKEKLVSVLSNRQGAAYAMAAKSISRLKKPIRKVEDVTHLKGIGPVITRVIQEEFEKHPTPAELQSPSEETKLLAKKSIARFAQKRVRALRKYYDDSIAYMHDLPQKHRNMIYKALNGQIMQGPFSDGIKRISTLLYAKDIHADILLNIVEIVARAPPLPIRYSLYRGMHMSNPPVINETEIFQEIPFSTTFISNYALGWILAKKAVALRQELPCCLFELSCHQGTKGLYLSKLPWMDPWTTHNAPIFDRIAPNNIIDKFHIKVNSQNELLMFPYRLKVVGKRTKSFKELLDKQLETLDTHYEFDAAQRNLGSLFTYHSDLLEKEVDVYILELQPISLYKIKIHPDHITEFESQKLVPGASQNVSSPFIFYSPEEIDLKLQDRLNELEAKGFCEQTKIIEKGRYVGSKTF